MRLSILIPSIPERIGSLKEIIEEYSEHIQSFGVDAEIISIMDNKKRSIGQKRTDLIRISKGDYIVMTDDDSDRLTQKFFESINAAMEQSPDVITYWQFARINDVYTLVNFRLNNPIDYENNLGVTNRPAWHCCTWKRDVVKDICFGDVNWGEDDVWAREANKLAKTEINIHGVCHTYQHDSHLTAAFQ